MKAILRDALVIAAVVYLFLVATIVSIDARDYDHVVCYSTTYHPGGRLSVATVRICRSI